MQKTMESVSPAQIRPTAADPYSQLLLGHLHLDLTQALHRQHIQN